MSTNRDDFRERVRAGNPIEDVIGERVKLRRNGRKLMGLCPFHEEKTPSFSVNKDDGLYHCFGCKASGDVFKFVEETQKLDFRGALELLARRAGIPIPERGSDGDGRPVSHRPYTDAGKPVMRVSRLVDENGKTLRRPDGGKRIWREYRHGGAWCSRVPDSSKPDTSGLIYNYAAVIEAIAAGKTIHIAEGENKADALIEMGFVATCNAGGAGNWKPEHAEHLRGATDVVVWQDCGGPGRGFLEDVGATLVGFGTRIRTVYFGDGKPDNYDLVDWAIEERRRGRDEKLIAGMVEELVKVAPEWKPALGKDSAAPRDGVPAESFLRFRTAAELCREAPEDVPWIVPGYVPQGALVELDGKVKAGKTTFLAAMVRQVVDGGTFLGNPVKQGKVLWLTEQPTTSFADALRGAGLEDRDDLLLLQWVDTRGFSWEKVAPEAVEEAKRFGAILLLVDTLGQFAGIKGDGENSAGEAQRSAEPLQVAAADGLAVVTSRHERKSGGEIGDSARGSSAWSGAVDVILKLSRPEGAQPDNVRVLSAVGRFRETPAEQVIELREGLYVSLGTQQDVAAQKAREKILAECPTEPEKALTLTELVDRLKIKRTTCQLTVEALHKSGHLGRTGEGKRGKPWRYCRAQEDSFRRNSIPKQTVPAETNPQPGNDSAETPAGSGRNNLEPGVPV